MDKHHHVRTVAIQRTGRTIDVELLARMRAIGNAASAAPCARIAARNRVERGQRRTRCLQQWKGQHRQDKAARQHR